MAPRRLCSLAGTKNHGGLRSVQSISFSFVRFDRFVAWRNAGPKIKHFTLPIFTFSAFSAADLDIYEKLKILKGRLPPEDSSDRRETLGKRVSDDFAKMIFRGENFFRGDIFWKNRKF